MCGRWSCILSGMAEQVEFTQPTTGKTVWLSKANFDANYAHLVKPARKPRKKKDQTDGED